jgi:acyl transferase domain-containing protein
MRSNLWSAAYSQPICTALQIALVELLRDWGIIPDRIVGHSSGEIAGAYCVGALSRESAWKVAYYRGLVSASLAERDNHGAMLAVGLSEDMIGPYMKQAGTDVVVACVNSPSSVTISGRAGKIAELEKLLQQDKVFARRLQVKVAYHSPSMNDVAGVYRSLIHTLSSGTPPSNDCIMFSSVTGSQITSGDLVKGEYWIQNLVSQVKFAQALSNVIVPRPTKLAKARIGVASIQIHHLLEVGPHSTLRGPILECLAVDVTGGQKLTYGSMLARGKSGLVSALSAAGHMYALGFPPRVSSVNESPKTLCQRRFIPGLPLYPFNRSTKYWREGRMSKATDSANTPIRYC